LGGVGVCASNGSIDNVAESESEAFAQIRRFLSYLPSSAWEAPPRNTSNDLPDRKEEDLLSIIPKQRNMPYDIRRLISLVHYLTLTLTQIPTHTHIPHTAIKPTTPTATTIINTNNTNTNNNNQK